MRLLKYSDLMSVKMLSKNVGDDVEDEAEEDDSHVEVMLDAINLDDEKVVLDEAVVVDDVYVVDVVNLLDDEVVGVDEVKILVDVVVVVNINVTGDGVVCDDLDVVVVVADAGKLLLVNDDVDEVGVDHLGDVMC